ncbi:TetR/AcrR family transcriptional regulator [Xylanimonas protaetiae]|uniref:TetR/AcrR family transcriptional regulator n=1 Tax=Xylanimonas protaetiae TaxID=2509457 RepID=A0A4P6F8P5_9MICO|nr:TetR/AcrR family transcriptional regulator [Xylanimonas protaetiae]QAY70699.1 TetR/AcrR family transcriptional regulator [Xylanimonas protaetiae]
MPRDGSETRERILTAAMQRFVEQGYDKTSLREIAEDVGVTKAALYYHFRTKDDIVRTALAGILDQVHSFGAWAAARPRTPQGDAELVDRLLAFADGDAGQAMRFVQANPTAMTGAQHDATIARLVDVVGAVTGDSASAEDGLRAVLAYAAVMVTLVGNGEGPLPVPGGPEERRAAARRVALELVSGIGRG